MKIILGAKEIYKKKIILGKVKKGIRIFFLTQLKQNSLIEMNGKKEGKRKEWTLVQNQDYLKKLLLLSEKKSLGVIG